MRSPSFYIQTFGCQMNVNDSDWLSRSLVSRGYAESTFERADLYILNTCSVRDKPEQKVYSELGRIARMAKVQKRKVTVCVGGCVAQQVGDTLRKRFPEVRLLFGTDGIALAPDAIGQLLENPSLSLNLLDFAEQYKERPDDWSTSTVPASAFVNIMQGCDNFCTYCIVPYVRGRQKSRDADAVIEECKALVGQGSREITLLGQNVNSFGQDTNGLPFADLLYKLAKIDGLERLRFMTPHPKDIAAEVIAAFAELPILCPRVHLPLQSGSDAILKKMGRRYTADKFLAIVDALKKVRPDMIFTTDIIVGFPGESEEDFLMTLEVMKQVGFAASFSFVYSDRPKAKAILLPGKVERQVSLGRLSRLQSWQNTHSEHLLAAQVGKKAVILLENKSNRDPLPDNGRPVEETTPLSLEEGWESWQGKTEQGFFVNVTLPPFEGNNSNENKSWAGKLLPVVIEASARHSLKGSQAGEPW